MSRKWKFVETKISGFQGMERGRMGSDKNILETNSGDGCRTLWIY